MLRMLAQLSSACVDIEAVFLSLAPACVLMFVMENCIIILGGIRISLVNTNVWVSLREKFKKLTVALQYV